MQALVTVVVLAIVLFIIILSSQVAINAGTELKSISGTTFLDKNANGLRDTGELGMANVTIILSNQNSSIEALSTLNGTYSFQKIPDIGSIYASSSPEIQEQWEIRDKTPKGYFITSKENPCLLQNNLIPGYGGIPHEMTCGSPAFSNQSYADGNLVIDYAYAPLSSYGMSISGIAYLDENSNELRDIGEREMDNVTIIFRDALGDKTETPTGPDGAFKFRDMIPYGNARISAMTPNGYFMTERPETIYGDYDRGALLGEELNNINFGFAPLSSHGLTTNGTAYLDENGNGVRDLGELGMANVTIRVNDASGRHEIVTTSDGSYSFQVAEETSIYAETPTGYFVTEPGTEHYRSSSYHFNASLGKNEPRDFGYTPLSTYGASISGFVYLDKNINGVRDIGDLGLHNVSISIGDTNNYNRNFSSADGSYSFRGLTPGEITISGEPIYGYYQLEGIQRIELAPQDLHSNFNLGYVLISDYGSSVSGTAYHDENVNGVRDGNELGMANVTLRISDDNYYRDHEIMTSSGGSYSFSVVPGKVTVQSIIPEGYSITNPFDNYYSFDISANESRNNITFGYIPMHAITRNW